jgi:hypothetical protein
MSEVISLCVGGGGGVGGCLEGKGLAVEGGDGGIESTLNVLNWLVLNR